MNIKKITDCMGCTYSDKEIEKISYLVREAEMAEREACALAVMDRGRNTKNGEWHGNNHAAEAFAECIRERSNVEFTGGTLLCRPRGTMG
jgi:hypothetical protein